MQVTAEVQLPMETLLYHILIPFITEKLQYSHAVRQVDTAPAPAV